MAFKQSLKEFTGGSKFVCTCWDCLRAEGITPTRDRAPKHPDKQGNVYRVDNGLVARKVAQG